MVFIPYNQPSEVLKPGKQALNLPKFQDPEWLIMFLAVLSVKMKIKTYVQIHKMVTEYWDLITKGLNLKPISERQLRDR